MSVAATSFDLIRPLLPFEREAVDGVETVGDRAGRLPGHASSVPTCILLLDDDSARLGEQLRRAFPAPRYRVQVAGSGSGGLRHLHANSPDVILLDWSLSEPTGLENYQQIRHIDPRIPVIFITGVRRADAAIEAMKQGAYDVLFKPVELSLLRRVVGDALEAARPMRGPAVLAESAPDSDVDGAIVGSCPAMREVYKAIGRVTAQDVPVLITGESGTGKELVARAIYQHGRRSKAPFLALNCAAIPEPLLESELFGHEKGAFTGADRQRIGKFEQCHGGTLFLDEIGDMPPALQAKLLRVLQEQSFERVGGNGTVTTDVRIISATHRDLKALVADGRFRPDLYYRLGVFCIHLPPLRERGDDLPPLVNYFLRRFSRELGRDVREVDPEALEWLRSYSWPGNVRELQSVLKQALLRAAGPVLLPAMLPDLTAAPAPAVTAASSASRPGLEEFMRKRLAEGSEGLYEEVHREVDRVLLPLVMDHTRGNQFQAAKVLRVARQTLRGRVRELQITPRFTDPAEGDPD